MARQYDEHGNRIGVCRNAYKPDGTPKYVRVYDNGGETVDRYTVVYSQMRDGWQRYTLMSGAPFYPQGVCQHGEIESWRAIDRPRYGHLGRKIRYEDLPADCQRAVMQDYRAYWGSL